MRSAPYPFVTAVVCLATILSFSAAVEAQYPGATLFSIFPAGGQAGTSFEVILDGENLDETTEIHFSHPGIHAKPLDRDPKADLVDSVPSKFEVTIDSDVPKWQYEARAVGKYGISNPRAFQVGHQPELTVKQFPSADAGAQPIEIGVGSILNGRTTKEKIDVYYFTATAGQRVLIEAHGRRIDSRADLTLVVTDEAGGEITRCNDYYGRDPLIDLVVPRDGRYQLHIYDFLFQGGNDYFYRLSLSTAPKIDFIFPPAGLPGSKATYTLFGRNLPGNVTVSDWKLGESTLERIDVEVELPSEAEVGQRLPSAHPSEASVDAFNYQLESPDGESVSFPIYFATAPIVKEQEPNNTGATSQLVTPPCEVVGQFNPSRDQDWYTFEAKKGEVYFLEVISRRMQCSTDALLRVQRVAKDASGKEQVTDTAELDDLPTEPRNPIRPTFEMGSSDPTIRLTIPQDGSYRVQIRDVFASSGGSPLDLYRLAIRKATPDFRLIAVTELPLTDEAVQQNRGKLYCLSMGPGGTLGINLSVLRADGFIGEVTIHAANLPPGITAAPLVIGPGATKGMLVLTAAMDAPRFNGDIRITGRATIGEQLVEREAVGAALVWPVANFQTDPTRFRLTENIALSINPIHKVVASFAKVGTEADQGTLEVIQGEKLDIPVALDRPESSKEKLKIVAANLPKEFRADPLDIEAREGTLKLSVGKTALPGTYMIPLSSNIRVDYSHNPELAEAAAQKAKELSALTDAAKSESKTAIEAKNATRKASEKLKHEIDAAKKSRDKAIQNAHAAKNDLQLATERNTQASEALRQKPHDQELAKAATASDEERKRAAAKCSEAEKKTTESQKSLQQLELNAIAVKSEQTRADKAATEADSKAKTAVERSNQAQQRATRLANLAKPKSVYVPFYSQPITVKVLPLPAAEGKKP